MKREHKYGTASTAVGVPAPPFLVGIPLLAVGILLLAMYGRRLMHETFAMLELVELPGFDAIPFKRPPCTGMATGRGCRLGRSSPTNLIDHAQSAGDAAILGKDMKVTSTLTISPIVLAAALLASSLAADLARITVDAARPGHAIAPTLWGVFFEDINLSADGGIYPERVRTGRSRMRTSPNTGG